MPLLYSGFRKRVREKGFRLEATRLVQKGLRVQVIGISRRWFASKGLLLHILEQFFELLSLPRLHPAVQGYIEAITI